MCCRGVAPVGRDSTAYLCVKQLSTKLPNDSSCKVPGLIVTNIGAALVLKLHCIQHALQRYVTCNHFNYLQSRIRVTGSLNYIPYIGQITLLRNCSVRAVKKMNGIQLDWLRKYFGYLVVPKVILCGDKLNIST